MSDFGTPVAAGVNPGNPLQTIGSLLSLKRQQQGLVQQQQEIQGQAAQVQQEQLKAHEQQGIQDFFKSWDPSQHIAGDGTTDTESARQSPAYQNAGNAKPAIDLKLAEIKQAQLQNKQSLTTLNGDNLRQYGQVMQSLTQDPDVKADKADPVTGVNVGRIKVTEALKNFSQLGPDAARVAQIYAPITQHAPPGKLASGVTAMALQGQDIAGQQSQTNPQTVSADVGPALKFGTVDKSTGVPNFNNGPTLAKGLAPTDQPGYRADVASATSRAGGTAGSDIDRSNEVSGLQQSSAAAIPLTHRIDQLAHELWSGHLSKMLSETGNYLGYSSVNEARSQLNKDLGQVKGLAIQRAGSDSRAATVLEGYPTDTTPEGTVHAAMDYIRGTARQNLARGQLLSDYQKNDPQGLRGFQAADNILSRTTDPLAHEYLSLSPEQQKGFYRRNFSTPQEAQDFKNHINALKKHTSVFGQP